MKKSFIFIVLISIILSTTIYVYASSENLENDIHIEQNDLLSTKIGSVKINQNVIDGMVKAYNHANTEKNVTDKMVKDTIKDIMIVDAICEDYNIELSDSEADFINSYHETVINALENASKSTNELEQKNAQEVLNIYYSAISESGLTQEEYEELDREQMSYNIKKDKLIKEVFNGNTAEFSEFLESAEKQVLIDFESE